MSGSPGPAAGRWPAAPDESEQGEAQRSQPPHEAGPRIHAWGEGTGTGQRPAGGTGPEAVDETSAAILSDVAALTAERDEYLSALQRLKADFDNYRKRVARLQEEQAVRAAGDVVTKLLPVIDNLDLAWAHLGGGRPVAEVSEEARAIAQARQQLLDVLSREGLERLDAAEVPFDPTVHDAVAHLAAAEATPAATEVTPAAEATPAGSSAHAGAGSPGSSDGHEGPGRHDDATGGAEAAGAHPAGHPGGVTVDEVMRAGYRWRGQVLRPAMVRVRG